MDGVDSAIKKMYKEHGPDQLYFLENCNAHNQFFITIFQIDENGNEKNSISGQSVGIDYVVVLNNLYDNIMERIDEKWLNVFKKNFNNEREKNMLFLKKWLRME